MDKSENNVFTININGKEETLYVVEFEGTRAIFNIDAFCLIQESGKSSENSWKALKVLTNAITQNKK